MYANYEGWELSVFDISQNIIMPDNEIELSWSDIDGANNYRVYDKNLIIMARVEAVISGAGMNEAVKRATA